MTPLRITDASSVIGLQQEIQRSEESRYDHRLHGVLLVAQGMTCPEVARLLGDAPRSVEYWVHRFERQGFGWSGRGRTIGASESPEPTADQGNQPRVASQAERRRHARELVGWQDAVGLDRQKLWD